MGVSSKERALGGYTPVLRDTRLTVMADSTTFPEAGQVPASATTKKLMLNEAVSAATWPLLGATTLANRLVLGWVYWGGASRRFIYATQKIDPTSPGYLANKLVHAAPGAPFGLEGILHWLLGMPALLQISVTVFSLAELVVGVGLIAGFATRFLSLVAIGLAVVLMVIFGWMGSTCLDEWTMAANGFAMACVTMLTGSGPWSVDNWLLRTGRAVRWPWFAWVGSGALPIDATRFCKAGVFLGIASIAFAVFFYGYNFDGIYSPLGKRVDNAQPGMSLIDPVFSENAVTVHAYVNAGPDTQGLYVVRAVLAPAGQTGAAPVFDYDAKALAKKGFVAIKNDFAPWSSCRAIAYGLRCQLGSKAALSFPIPAGAITTGAVGASRLALTLTDIEGKTFAIPVD